MTSRVIDQADLVKNHRIFGNIITMCHDREYKFPNKYPLEELMALDPDGVNKLPFVSGKLTNLNECLQDDRGTPIYIYILNDQETFTGAKHKETVSKEISRNLAGVFNPIKPTNKDLFEILNYVHLILVFNNHNRKPEKLYEATKFEVESFPMYNYELWPKHRLMYNPTQGHLVAKHILLKEDELKNVREKSKLNRICLDDPINRWYYGQPDQIYRIHRIGQGLNYRVVTKKTLASLAVK